MQNNPPATPKHFPCPVSGQNVSCQRNLNRPRGESLCFVFCYLFAFILLLKLKSPQKRNKICEQRNSRVPQGCNRLKKKGSLVNFLGGSRAAEMSTVCQQMFVYGSFDTFSEAQWHKNQGISLASSFLGKKNLLFFFFYTFLTLHGATKCKSLMNMKC